MTVPFRIHFLPKENAWAPLNPEVADMARYGYDDGLTPRSVILQGLFSAVSDAYPGTYELDDAVTLYDAKQEAFAKINARTKELVEQGFDFQGSTFACTESAQIRYLGMLSARDMITYPLIVSSIDDVVGLELLSATHVLAFCATCISHVRVMTDSGTALKNAVRGYTVDTELDGFVDTRELGTTPS